MSHKKWRREHEASQDRQQTQFRQDGTLKEKSPLTSQIMSRYDVTDKFMCPFCLAIAPLQKFLISTSKGIHQGLAKCPECGNQCRMSTLVSEWTPEQYAEFVYPYSASGFWQKVPFETWNKRLRKIGWAYRFWARYKALKGEEGEENYAQWLERTQREAAEEAGYVDEHG